MDLHLTLTFFLIALVIEVSPGPNFLLVTKSVSMAGRATAIANILGFSTAFILHGALSIFGFSVILSSSTSLFFAVKMLGAAYLCYLGVQALLDAHPRLSGKTRDTKLSVLADIDLGPPLLTQQSLVCGWRQGFITNCLNPKISMFYLAAFPQFLGTGSDTTAGSFLLVMIHMLVNAVWFLLVTVVIERLMLSARSDRFARFFKMLSGVALIGFGTSFAVSAAVH